MLQVSTWSPVRMLTRMGSPKVMDTIIMSGSIVRRDMVIMIKRVGEAGEDGVAEVASECKLIKAKSL